jgi:tetratricopeptide (TPR) repeat protein
MRHYTRRVVSQESHPIEVQLRSLGRTSLRHGGDDHDDDDAGMLERVVAAAIGTTPPVQSLGRFEIRRRIGQGGMGAVYEAWDPQLHRRVAIKRLRRELATHARRRGIIEAEARALAQLADRHVVQVFETGEHAGALFVVMELVEGSSLDVWQVGRHTLPELLDKYVQVGRGLAAAHRAGLVHRDVKPGNVLVRHDGEVRVVDFGLALALDREVTSEDLPSTGGGAAEGSRTGSGTRAYMAPEQLAFGNADTFTDQFSFCVALWEAATGARPFDEAQLRALALSPEQEVTPTIGPRRLPTWLGRVLRRGLAARPGARWPSMAVVVDALVHTPQRRRRRLWVVVGLATIVTLAVALRAAETTRSCDASARIEPVWDAARGRELREVATDLPFGANALAFGSRALDAYASAWLDTYATACHETWRDGTRTEAQYGRTAACLDRALVEIDRAATLIAAAQPETLARVADLVDALPELAGCRDVEGDDEPTPRQLELLSVTDGARLLVAAGQPLEALDRLDRLRLGDLDGGAAAAGAWTARGVALATVARREEAAAALLRGESSALAADAVRRGVEVSRELVMLYAHGIADLGRAEFALGLLDGWSRRVELTPRERALEATARGLTAELRGDLEAALQLHRAAIDALSSLDEPVAEARARRRLGAVLQRSGRFDEAREAYRASGERLIGALGPDHPELGDHEHALGSLALDERQLDVAEAHFRRALALHESAFGVESVRLASTLAALAHVALADGDHAASERLAARAWSLQSTLPVGHPDRGSGLLVLASLHLADGAYAEALDEYEQAHRELYATMTTDERAIVDNNLGWLLCRLDRCAEARRHFELALVSEDVRVQHAAQCGLADVELSEGAPAAARDRARRVLVVVLASRRPGDEELVAELDWVLARALSQTHGPADEVRAAADRALAWYRGTGMHAGIASEIERFIAGLPGAASR